jgi:SH3 domain-containing protein
MTRQIAAVAIALALTPATLFAQSEQFTIGISNANVYKMPSTGSLVIGTAPRGAVLAVVRQVGDWVKISWPQVPDGYGYVHVSTGSMRPQPGSTPALQSRPAGTVASTAAAQPVAVAPFGAASDARTTTMAVDQAVIERGELSQFVAAPTHNIGFGGLMNGSTFGFGATGRVWSRRHVGAQGVLARYSPSPALAGVNSVQFGGSGLYSFGDFVGETLWARPYAGAGLTFTHVTERIDNAPFSESRRGYRVFGGSELTLPSVPHIALSADFGYSWPTTPLAGMDFGGYGFSIAAHWYVK